LGPFLDRFTREEHDYFMKETSSQTALMIELYVPILCVNGAIYKVAMSSGNEIAGFEPLSSFWSSQRVRNWPGKHGPFLTLETDGIPLMVTNVAGLSGVLERIARIMDTVQASIEHMTEYQKLTIPLHIAAAAAILDSGEFS
jgi:hypothetical protein